MTKIISFNPQGRLGNNIFEYFATKVLQFLLNCIKPLSYEYQYNKVDESVVIRENTFYQLYTLAKNGLFKNLNYNLYLDGFYQFDFYTVEQIDYIRTLFTVDNHDQLNDKVKVSDIAKAFESYIPEYTENDLVVHIRLDDFVNEGHNSFLIHPISYVNAIDEIQEKHNFKTIYIIVDKIRRVWEKNYIDKVLEELKEYDIKVLPQADYLTDMARIYHATNIVCGNSTFCWIPAMLGKNKNNWMPDRNTCSNQNFYKINKESKLYQVDYLKMTKQESIEMIHVLPERKD